MRITFPAEHERIGRLAIHRPGRIIELDSAGGTAVTTSPSDSVTIDDDRIRQALGELSVVVSIKDERRSTLRGVLAGIPGSADIVVISASAKRPVDRFELEREVIAAHVAATGRPILHLDQHDPKLAPLVEAAGMGALVEEGLVRSGKGEAMVLGTLIADARRKEAVAFVDADNYVPGAVNEYVRIYAATMVTTDSPFTMGRISWQSKPKIEGGQLVFNRWGRSTAVSNRALNEVISHYLGEGTRIVTTGNAGEHVISMPLARVMRMRGGYAAETGGLVDLLEQFGGIVEPVGPMPDRVTVVQTETINPHFHEDKGSAHVASMRDVSLSAIVGSPVCPPAVRDAYRSDADEPLRYESIAASGAELDLGAVEHLAEVAP